MRLTLCYRSAADLAAQLGEHRAQGALLLRGEPPAPLQQFQALELELRLSEEQVALRAEVLQVIAGLGIAVRLLEPDEAQALVGSTAAAASPAPPELSWEDELAAPRDEVRAPRGSGPLSWPIEKLQAEWHTLTPADKVRVAKYGRRPARAIVLRLQDSQMHQALLSNPGLTPEEVAVLAGTGSLDPAVLTRIISSTDWTRHTAIVRNLIAHPKATLQQVTKLADLLGAEELRRLTRTGKVRASVKRIIIKKLEQRGGQRTD